MNVKRYRVKPEVTFTHHSPWPLALCPVRDSHDWKSLTASGSLLELADPTSRRGGRYGRFWYMPATSQRVPGRFDWMKSFISRQRRPTIQHRTTISYLTRLFFNKTDLSRSGLGAPNASRRSLHYPHHFRCIDGAIGTKFRAMCLETFRAGGTKSQYRSL